MKRPITKAFALGLTIILLLATAGCQNGADTAAAPASSESTQAASAAESPAADSSAAGEASEPGVESEPEPEPNNDWELDSPENQGMDEDLLAELHTALVGVESIRSMVTAKGGYLVDEYYQEGYDETSVFRLHSCSKSFTGALVGIAIDQGLISGVDAKLSQFLSQINSSDSAYRKEITLKHLLTHTSGIEWHEWGGNSSSWRPFQDSENWVDYILGRPMVAEPGTYFAYSTGGSHLLAAALQKATGKSVYEYGVEQIFEPLGMDSVEWSADPQDITDGGNGIAMTARDAAKFGQLYLNGGKWRQQQIIPAAWVESSTVTQHAGPGGSSGTYGYQWWVRQFGDGNYDSYYAMGAGGQFIFVVPELELVTVITSRSTDTYAPRAYFMDYIIAACESEESAEEAAQ